VTVWNPLYNSTFSAYISIFSAMKNINFIKNSSISKKLENRKFSIKYDSLGEPSCAKVWFSVGKNVTKPVTYGTNKTICNNTHPFIPYSGPYVSQNNTFNFTMLMFIEGLVIVNVSIKSNMESIELVTTATVSNRICDRPKLEIINRAKNFLNPTIMKRSQPFSLISKTKVVCNFVLNNTKQWFVYEIDQSNGTKLKIINLTDVPSATNAEISISSGFLRYGTYLFIYQVAMNDEIGSFVESIDTYIRIVPTGIAIQPFASGIKEITIGKGQSIDIDPGKYSFDLDGLISGTEVAYRYFCRTFINGIRGEFPSLSFNNILDLKQVKDVSFPNNNSNNNNQTNCFEKPGKFIKKTKIFKIFSFYFFKIFIFFPMIPLNSQ
jgi:hypothetical protein